MSQSTKPAAEFRAILGRALDRRRGIEKTTQAYRVLSGAADGLDGVFVDVYDRGAVLIVYEGTAPRWFDPVTAAGEVLSVLGPSGVVGVYHKPFARDRSKLGGELPECVTRAAPLAGEPLPESTLIREHGWNLEVRLFDGLSTGLFLDQRENRKFVLQHVSRRSAQPGRAGPVTVLNTFAYTCAFSIAAAVGGAATTSVDVSARYLEWGKRNFAHNGLNAAKHWFAKMDTFDFLGYARKKGLRYDVVILDPPSFASGSKKKGIRPWSSVDDYARLVSEAASVLNQGGMIVASTNTQELCRQGRLDREITKGLGKEPSWVKLPPVSIDFARDQERFAARAFTV